MQQESAIEKQFFWTNVIQRMGKGRAKNQNEYHYTFHRDWYYDFAASVYFFCCFFARHHFISHYTCYTYVQYATITEKTNTFSSGNTCVNWIWKTQTINLALSHPSRLLATLFTMLQNAVKGRSLQGLNTARKPLSHVTCALIKVVLLEVVAILKTTCRTSTITLLEMWG